LDDYFFLGASIDFAIDSETSRYSASWRARMVEVALGGHGDDAHHLRHLHFCKIVTRIENAANRLVPLP
jgi:hypothetical protein